MFLAPYGKNVVALPRRIGQQHGVIVGGSGTGKSRGYFLPNAAYSVKASLVCTDPKSELWNYTSGLHRQATRYAPSEPEKSACFNWIPLCRDARIAELCARAIVEAGNTQRTEQAWIDTETAFLSALFSHASTLSEPTPLTAYRLFTRQRPEALLRQLLTSTSEAAQEQAIIFEQSDRRMRGAIVPVLAAKLQFLRDPALARFTSAQLEPPNFQTLRERPEALYWCLREQDIARLRPLTSLFFTLLLEQMTEDDSAGPPAIPVICLLDEFGNLGVLPQFETTIAVARSRGISLWLGLQGLSQLEAGYGAAGAKTILANCATKIALSGLDVESADYFSRSLGLATVVTRRRAWHLPGLVALPRSHTQSQSENARPLLTSDEVRRLGGEEAIVIVGNRRPMRLPKAFYAEKPTAAPTTELGEARAMTVVVSTKLEEKEEGPPPFPDELREALRFVR